VAALSRMQGFKSALDVVHALRLAVAAVVAMAAAASPPLQVAGDEMLELFSLAVARAKPSNACSVAAYLDMFHVVDGGCGAEYSDYVYATTLFRSAVMLIATASDEQDKDGKSVAFSAPSSSSASNRPAQSLEEMARGQAREL
jgi:ABC-type phosphate/phosphonate transport system substrate-binding protein